MKTKLLELAVFLLLFAFFASGSANAATRIKGYVKGNGTYVKPHYKTPANGTKLDNYSTKGNINAYTGKKGTVNPLKTPRKK